jgi:hypothetical protein
MTPRTVLFLDGPQAGNALPGITGRQVGYVDPSTGEQGVYFVHILGLLGRAVFVASVQAVAADVDRDGLWALLVSEKAQRCAEPRREEGLAAGLAALAAATREPDTGGFDDLPGAPSEGEA